MIQKNGRVDECLTLNNNINNNIKNECLTIPYDTNNDSELEYIESNKTYNANYHLSGTGETRPYSVLNIANNANYNINVPLSQPEKIINIKFIK